MNKFLPSKRLIVFFVLPMVTILTISILFLRDKKDNNPIIKENNTEKVEIITANINDQTDSDNDGLKDWQEALYKTDPNNPDTDKDRTNDGEEIKQNRNPLMAGPNDKIETSFTKENIYSGNYEDKNLTETDKLARRFFSGYIGLKQTDKLNSETQDSMITSLIDQSIKEITIKQYEIKDLKISNEQNIDIVKKYQQELDNSLSKLLQLKEYELFVLAAAIQNKDEMQYRKLDLSVKVYKEVVADLLNITIPKDIVPAHLDMINNLNALAECIRGMTLIENDPIVAIKSINDFKEAEKNLGNSSQEVALYLSRYTTN